MQVLVEDEAARLVALIRKKVWSSAVDERRRDAFDDWLRYRFYGPLERNAAAGPAFGKSATAIGVGTIGAGLLSSALSTVEGSGAAASVLALGVIVGVLGYINQIWRPAQRSVTRYQSAFALRREGWDFLYERGRYEGLAEDKSLALFIDEVARIHRAVELVDETAAQSDAGG
jgi:hypothetical protein